jgi:hypothetical protein
MKKLLSAVALAGLLGSAVPASATTLFSEDFEGTLAQWSPNAHGQIVVDPLNAANNVLNFSAVYSNGDIFSSVPITLISGMTYTIAFDFYGVKGSDSSSGGFAGLASGTNATNERAWYAGSYAYPNLLPGGFVLADAPTVWTHYVYSFVAPIKIGAADPASAMRLMFEDFNGAGSTAGNAYFDNITITATPVPAALPLFASGLGALGLLGWRRKRKYSALAAA